MRNTPARPELPQPFGVACHDAGGARQIVATLVRWGWRPSWIHVKGPAFNIFKKEFSNVQERPNLAQVGSSSAMLTGTGWGSDIEHQARRAAKQSKVRSIAVLDHWTNYKERFVREGETVLPDEIWVVDSFAEDLARQMFPDVSVVRVPDSLAELELKRIAPISNSTPDRVLYLLEPVRSDWGRSEPGEFQALRYFLERWPCLNLPANTEVFLRLHPSERPEKYAEFISKKTQPRLQFSQGSLSEDISCARWIAGCQTHAMTLALAASRRVFSTLPPWAPPKVLPHSGIEYLREIEFA